MRGSIRVSPRIFLMLFNVAVWVLHAHVVPHKDTDIPHVTDSMASWGHDIKVYSTLRTHQQEARDRSRERRAAPLNSEGLWDEYNSCLESQESWLEDHENLVEFLMMMEKQQLQLHCNACKRPTERIQDYEINWRRTQVTDPLHERQLQDDGERIFMTPGHTLLITELHIDDAGEYVCYHHNVFQSIYKIDVLPEETSNQVVESGEQGNQPAQPVELPENNLYLYTTWSEWTDCSECDQRGMRRKTGMCTVMKLDNDSPISPVDTRIFSKFTAGLPCRSTHLPHAIYNLPQVVQRKSETMLGYCWIPCPTLPPLTYVTDENGAVIEVVRSGEGYISLREGAPTLPPIVKRKTYYAPEKTAITLECPDERAPNVAVRWQNNTQVLDPLLVRRHSRGRIRIDASNSLRIMRLRYWDNAPYSCWIDGQHIATLKVKVVSAGLDANVKDYLILAGVAASLLLLLGIGISLCRGRKRKALV